MMQLLMCQGGMILNAKQYLYVIMLLISLNTAKTSKVKSFMTLIRSNSSSRHNHIIKMSKCLNESSIALSLD